jgi:ATP-dependent RNA helicase DeaD
MFTNFNIPEALISQLTKLNFIAPTPIQEQVIPLALEGKDILASAQTGSGKTMAFLLPLISKLTENLQNTALIMVPTRELADQVATVAKKLLSYNNKINIALLIGGESMMPQYKQLERKPNLVIGTPGRIYDHMKRKTLNTKNICFLVLDETDRMLGLGFEEQLAEIATFLPKERQCLMFSATIAPKIMSVASTYLKDHVRISVGTHSTPAPNIEHQIIYTAEEKKYAQLVDQLNVRDGSVIIFVKTKRRADNIAERLNDMNLSADAIHGDLMQRQRQRVINRFRKQDYRIMVATDVASRGLDIDHVKHVINYDLPHSPEDYIHRIGRTARAGASGSALCLISPDDQKKWTAINRMMNPDAPHEKPHYNDNKRPAKRSSNGFGPRRDDNAPRGAGFGFKRDEARSGGFRRDENSSRPSGGGFRRDENSPRPSGGGFRRDENSPRPSGGGFRRDENSPRPSGGGFRRDDNAGSAFNFKRDENSPRSSRPTGEYRTNTAGKRPFEVAKRSSFGAKAAGFFSRSKPN